MKKVLGILAIAGVMVACNNTADDTTTTDSTTTTTTTVDTTMNTGVDTMNTMVGDSANLPATGDTTTPR